MRTINDYLDDVVDLWDEFDLYDESNLSDLEVEQLTVVLLSATTSES